MTRKLFFPVLSICFSLTFALISCSKNNNSNTTSSRSNKAGQTVPLAKGIILFDNVKAYEQPFQVLGSSIASFNTGDIVDVGMVQRTEEEQKEKVSYGVIYNNQDVWVSGDDLLLSEQPWYFESFKKSTWIPQGVHENMDVTKTTIFSSPEFFERMSHNPNPESRSIAYRKLLWIGNSAEAIADSWESFYPEKDAAVRSQAFHDLYQRLETMKNAQREEAVALIENIIPHVSTEEATGLMALKGDIQSTEALHQSEEREPPAIPRLDAPEVVALDLSLSIPGDKNSYIPEQLPKVWEEASSENKLRMVSISCRSFRAKDDVLAMKIFELAYNDNDDVPYQRAKRCISPQVIQPTKGYINVERVKLLAERVRIKERKNELKNLLTTASK